MEKKNKKDSLNFKNLATKDDIRELDKKMDEQGVRLDKKIDERFGKLDKKIDLVGASLQGQITRIENKINTEMATKDDINRVITYMDKFVEIADTYKKGLFRVCCA